jgi:hypothetical protein
MAKECFHAWKKTLLPKVEKCRNCGAYRRLFGSTWAVYDPAAKAQPKDEKGWK